jgi:peptidoglycan/LPS O-acetylase OafA/YrhL
VAEGGNGSSSRLGYRPELDGLRGIAIILVLLVHAFDWPKGSFIGVDIFFALSGFLITTLLLEEWNSRGSISLRDFYLRRYYRLFPALAAMLAVYVLFVVVVVHTGVGIRVMGAAFGLTYTANWAQAFDLRFPDTEIGHLWTLGIEEQFYLVWPALLLLLLRRNVGLRGTALALLVMIVAVVAWRNFLISDGASASRTYLGTDTRFDELFVGCLAGVLFVWRGVRRPVPWLPGVAVAAGVFLAYRVIVPYPWTFWTVRTTLTLVAVATSIVVFTCVTDSLPVLNRVLSMRWLVFVGVISYSLYLWHVPVGVLMREVFGLQGPALRLTELGASFAVACGSYFIIELRFVKRRRAHQRLRETKTDVERGLTATATADPTALRRQPDTA